MWNLTKITEQTVKDTEVRGVGAGGEKQVRERKRHRFPVAK